MSEVLREGTDIYSIPGMSEAVLELQEKYGIELEEVEQGVRLARSAYINIYNYEAPRKKPTKHAVNKTIRALFTEAAESVPGLLLDGTGRPLPRYRYVASDILATTLDSEHPLSEYFTDIRDAKIVPHFKNTEGVIDDLLPLLLTDSFPYNQTRFILPEDPEHMPKTPFKDAREEANFYLTACLWMRRTDSNKAMRDLGRAFDGTRDFERDPFDPEVAATMSPEEIAEIFGEYPQLKMLAGNSEGLVHNMGFLLERFDGDIRNAYAGTVDFEEVFLRLMNNSAQDDPSKVTKKFRKNGMYGFEYKMVSMLTYYLIEAGLIPVIDYPPPIDQHLAKLTEGTGCVTIIREDTPETSDSEEMDEKERLKEQNFMTDYLQEVARNLYLDISVKYNVSINHIAQALWLLGSKNCSLSPATFSTVEVLDGRNSVIKRYIPNYDVNGSDTHGIYGTCFSCPLHKNGKCTSMSAGKTNHLLGILASVKRDSLENPGDSTLFGRDPEVEALTADTAAKGKDKADRRRITERRPAYELQKELAKLGVVATEIVPVDQGQLF